MGLGGARGMKSGTDDVGNDHLPTRMYQSGSRELDFAAILTLSGERK